MSKKYQDGFFHVCSALLELHESISVRSLAPFMEIPRSTLQNGLKRVNHLDTNTISVDIKHKVLPMLVDAYFDSKVQTISSSLTDEQIKELYSLNADDTTSTKTNNQGSAVDSLNLTQMEDTDTFDELDSELDEREAIIKQAKSGSFKDINDYVLRLARQKQRQQDISREERKVLREAIRSVNVLEDINRELVNLFKDNAINFPPRPTLTPKTGKKGVVQLSDLHLGELVNETISNRFDMEIASKRLHKFAAKTVEKFLNEGITSVALFMTGDMINSTRRISEITSYSGARVRVVVIAYMLIGQFIEYLYEHFDVTVAHVIGNESRLSEFVDTTNYLASDNFDLMIYDLLKISHEKEGLRFVDSNDNPMEQVVSVNNVNFLLVHGNGHSGLAATNKIENEVQKIKARYAEQDIRINYVLCGHIHSTYIANNFARSASLVGSNAYAERNLNFTSRAAQNIFVVYEDGTIDGTMIDLQEYDGYEGFGFDPSLLVHTSTKISKPVVHIV